MDFTLGYVTQAYRSSTHGSDFRAKNVHHSKISKLRLYLQPHSKTAKSSAFPAKSTKLTSSGGKHSLRMGLGYPNDGSPAQVKAKNTKSYLQNSEQTSKISEAKPEKEEEGAEKFCQQKHN